MYTYTNFKSKKALKEAVAASQRDVDRGPEVRLFAPGLGKPVDNGVEYVEGPHYPKPHSWYAAVEVVNGVVVAVKK